MLQLNRRHPLAQQVAEKTREVAHDTLVEVHRQGAQLEGAELGLQEVGWVWVAAG